MAKSGDPRDTASATKLVTGGRRAEWTGAVVNPPVWRASTHLYENYAALKAGPKDNADGRFFYGRRGAPTQWSLAEALTEIEPGAFGTILYPSGVSPSRFRRAIPRSPGIAFGSPAPYWARPTVA